MTPLDLLNAHPEWTVIGNGKIDHRDRANHPAGLPAIRFNDWSHRFKASHGNVRYGGNRCDLIVTNGDSHWNRYGTKHFPYWPKQALFVRRPGRFEDIVKKYYTNYSDILCIESEDMRKIESDIGTNWVTAGTALLWYAAQSSATFYVSGFDWSFHNQDANGHHWRAERLWARKNLIKPRFVLSQTVTAFI